jgi:uncharacterized membrane protein
MTHDRNNDYMDLGIVAGVAMLVAWAVATVFFDAPGWVHLLLTAGVFLLVWRVVANGARKTGTSAR